MSLIILVVDDDPAILLSASYALEKSGHSVITAENGQEALKMIEEYQPHIIITDIIMPLMDGYELIRWLRQRPAFRLIPVVFLTGRTETEERIRGYQLGADAYLFKPFELNELDALIRNLLERSQLMLQLMRWDWRAQTHAQSIGQLDAIQQIPINKPKQTIQVEPTSQNLHSEQGQTVQIAKIHRIFLTQKEQAVLKFLAEGLSNSKIASYMYLSPRTVEKYVSNLLCKTGTSNRVELARFAMEHHLID